MKFLSTVVIFATMGFTVQAAWYDNLAALKNFQRDNYIEYHQEVEECVAPEFDQANTRTKKHREPHTSSHFTIPHSSGSHGESNVNSVMMMPLLTMLSIIFL